MVELQPLSIGIIRVLGRPAAIDQVIRERENIRAGRLSPTEALLVCSPRDETWLLETVRTDLAEADPHAVALIDSDSFAAWALTGTDADLAYARLSAIPPATTRPSFIQGLAADLPAKIFVAEAGLVFLVGSPVSHHFCARALEACANLGIVKLEGGTFTERLEPVA